MTTARQKATRRATAPAAPTQPTTAEAEGAPLLTRAVRAIVLFFAATLPFYFDLGVPEVSGDIRWMATSAFAMLCATLLLVQAVARPPAHLPLRWPPVMWFALGLAIWAAISMLDALNPSRGIILIKALYAQMILMVVVYNIMTPEFGRKLLWALVIPLLGTSLVGIWQFKGMNDSSFAAMMDSSWLFFALKPLMWVLDGVAGTIAGWMGWGERQLGLVGLATSYYLQSAAPGSTFANKNLAGSWTAMMLPIALYLLITAKRWPAQAFASLLLTLGSVFLVYSRARASWVALFCGLVTLAALLVLVPAWRKAIARHLDWSHGVWLLVPVVCLLRWGGDTSPLQGTYAVDRTPGQQVGALVNSSWNEIGGRLAYNLNSLVITKDYPLNGVGLGNFYTIYPPYYNEIVVTPSNSYNVMARPQRTHTDLMQAFTEMGLPGGILYAGLFITGIAMALRMAGRRAGAMGGYLIGAGLLTMMTGLTVFLEYQGMLALPGLWHYVLVAVQLGLLAALLAGAYASWRAAQKETHAADDVQLLGLMTGIGVLTICINALFDFPMQLPTAPAACLMMIGIIAALYMRYYPQEATAPLKRWLPDKLKLNRAGYAGALVLVLVAGVWALWDAYLFRQSNVLLKQGMIRIYSGINDDTTIKVLEKAWDIYPYDQRIQEHIAVAYANYNGLMPMRLDTRIAKLEWALDGDPWGANHMINLAGQYLQKAEQNRSLGNRAAFEDYLAKAETMFERLKQNADFSHYTWGVGGALRNLQGQPEEAMWMFRRALAIQPGYQPAVVGLQAAVSAASVKPAVVRDGMLAPR